MMLLTALLLPILVGLAGLAWVIRRRNMQRWLGTYVRDWAKRRDPVPSEEVHLLICIADHFEPKFGKASLEVARDRVAAWVERYPLLARFRDSDGRAPRHTFFYPAEEYEPELLDALAGLCAAGLGEVEVHLHHDNDTADNLRRTLSDFRDVLAHRHGLLARRPSGEVAYAFIHGNWALCNARPDGRLCGVNNELAVLRQTGCYVDMTLPSAPSPTQTPTINSIYYAVDRPGPRSHDTGTPAGAGRMPEGSLLLIQGPLLLDWGRRRLGIMPRVENGCLQATQPPTLDRVKLWTRARVQVPQRPDWFFVKLYAHGAPEDAHEVLLGQPMEQFHQALADEAARNPRFHYHYVTAREMYNLVKAAEGGWTGSVAGALDYELVSQLPATLPTRSPQPQEAG